MTLEGSIHQYALKGVTFLNPPDHPVVSCYQNGAPIKFVFGQQYKFEMVMNYTTPPNSMPNSTRFTVWGSPS